MNQWFVYIISTHAGLLYTGISTDVARRMSEHGNSLKGARSLRGKGPFTLEFSCKAKDRSQASILEARIKKLSRTDKLALIKGKLKVSNLL